MSRLRQYYANRYTSAEATNSEFENIIRYLNAAEVGNATVGELLDKLFDEDGNVVNGIAMRFNPSTGLEYTTDVASDTWHLLADATSIRGVPGLNVGTVEAPLFSNRVDFVATSGQVVYPYTASGSSTGGSSLAVWINGLLQRENQYTYSATNNTLTLASAPPTGSSVAIVTIRTNPVTAYRRSDLIASPSQSIFPFPFTATEELVVYRNGVLQREGGAYDFIKNSATATITMTTAQASGNLISIFCVSNSAIRDVAGLMLEDKYATNGLINLNRINLPDGSLSQDKIAGLVAALGGKAKITVHPSQPVSPAQGDLWVNTSYAVPTLLFYDGVRWLNASPNGLIPLAIASDSLKFLRLNSTATALEYANLDTSGLVQADTVGAAGGVAPLNALGKIPSANIPEYSTKSPIIGRVAGAIANADYVIGHIYGNQYTFSGLVCKLTSGTATVQLLVGGALVGSTLGANNISSNLALGPATVDSSASIKDVVLRVTGGAVPVDLSYMINAAITG